MKKIFAFTLLGFLLIMNIPVANAAVTASLGFSPSDPYTGEVVVVTWTKSSDNVGDGTQTGNIVVTYSGAVSGSLTTQAYTFAGGASITKTWTFRSSNAGNVNFIFDDQPSAGTAVDLNYTLPVVAWATADWTVSVSASGSTYSDIIFTGADVSPITGAAYMTFGKPVLTSVDTVGDDDINTGIRGVDRNGNLILSQDVFAWTPSSQQDSSIYQFVQVDNGGRVYYHDLSTFTNTTAGGADDTISSQISINNATGANIDSFVINPVVTDNMTFMKSHKVANNRVDYFFSSNSNDKFARYETTNGTQVFAPTVADTSSVVVWDDTTTGLAINAQTLAGQCTVNVCIRKFDRDTGVLATAAGSAAGVSSSSAFGNRAFMPLFKKPGSTTHETVIFTKSTSVPDPFMIEYDFTPTTLTSVTTTADCPQYSDDLALACFPFSADIDGGLGFLVCGRYAPTGTTETDGFIAYYNMAAGDDGNRTTFNLGLPGNPTPICLWDYDDGFYTFTDEGLSLIITHYTPNPDALLVTPPVAPEIASGIITEPVGGNSTSTITGNPISNAVAYSTEAWGFDTSLLFGMFLVGSVMMVAARRSGSVMITAILGLIALGFAIKLELAPVWILYLSAFIIIAVAGAILFGGRNDEDD